MNAKIHLLANGATVIVTSPGHGFRFSDGTVAEPQVKEVCDMLTCHRRVTPCRNIHGMAVNEIRMILEPEQLVCLGALCRAADIVLVPFPVLTALREQGVRDHFPNALAMNATPDTQRSAPADKIVDINNWSY